MSCEVASSIGNGIDSILSKQDQAAVQQANQWLATLKRQCDSLLNCADKLLDLLEITIKQADALKSWLVDAPKEANKH